MSSGLFHTDWYTDPPWERVSLSWLLKYVNNVRTNPVLARALAADKDQFEMVPMPKEVIEHLAAAKTGVPTSIGFASPEHLEAATAVTQKLGRALKSGKADDAAALLAPSYHDVAGRDAAKAKDELHQVLGKVGDVELAPLSAEDVMLIGGRLVANVHARFGRGGQQSARVELVMEKGAHGWLISGLRTI